MTGNSNNTILIIDDEKNIRTALRLVLEGENYQVFHAESAEAGLEILSLNPIDLVLLDLKLPKMGGMDALKIIKKKSVNGECGPGVIVISGQATTAEALETVKMGAFDFLEKPLDRSRILVTVQNAMERRVLLSERNNLASELADRFQMVGQSPVMLDLFQQIEKVAPTNGRVLITGESGTGKELVARAIHKASTLKDAPFVKVNCAAIPPELIESALFGHEKGAFTGAVKKTTGLFELADKGTIFLDEIGDMSLNAQAKVLRVLQSGEFSRVGGEKTIVVKVRVIAATNRALEDMVHSGSFREDLYFRLSVLPIKVPPLRERSEDIPLLVNAFSKSFCEDYGFRVKSIDHKVIEVFKEHKWSGNVRELKNQVERMVILSSDHIGIKDLPVDYIQTHMPGFELDKFSHLSLKQFKQEMEKEFILMKLKQYDWNITKTAESLKVERTNLHKKVKSLGLFRDVEE
jgi:two-component system, NtrC family, nitrogen regulation response regulator NtrX